MQQLLGQLLITSKDRSIYVCDLTHTSHNVYIGELSETVKNAIAVTPEVKSNAELVKQENGEYELHIKRFNANGLELKSVKVVLESARNLTTSDVVGDLINKVNEVEEKLAELKINLVESQQALDIMVEEKAGMQESALKTISAILSERNSLIKQDQT